MGTVRHRFTVEEYRKMEEAGIFHEDDRVELIDGEVVEMAAIGKRHVESVMRLNRLLSRWTLLEAPDNREGGVEYLVSVQNPVFLSQSGASARSRRRTQARGLLGRARPRGGAADRGGSRHLPRLRPEH